MITATNPAVSPATNPVTNRCRSTGVSDAHHAPQSTHFTGCDS